MANRVIRGSTKTINRNDKHTVDVYSKRVDRYLDQSDLKRGITRTGMNPYGKREPLGTEPAVKKPVKKATRSGRK